MASHWFWDYEHEARRKGDSERVRLTSFYKAGSRVSHDFPDQKLAHYARGRDLSKRLGEPWWEMFYEHLSIQVLLYGKHAPGLALDRAVRAVFEVSKPQFDAFPERFSLKMDLASTYLGIDPIGYEIELRALFMHIREDCGLDPERHAYYLQEWGYFLELIEDPGAVDAAFVCLENAQRYASDHYLMVANKMVCLAMIRFAPDLARLHLGDIAESGEVLARRLKYHLYLAEFLMWRAVAARYGGQEDEAQRFYREALAIQSRLPPPRNIALFAAIAFHEANEDIEGALRICQQDVRVLHSHGLTFLMAQRRLDKCRLLIKQDRDYSREALRLQRVAAGLRSRNHWENRLRELQVK